MDVLLEIQTLIAPAKALLAPIVGLPDMFEKCFLNTLQTTMRFDEKGRAFIITGDIPAMWLRDSTMQVLHYLRFADRIPALAQMIDGLIKNQIHYILIDPYANAFNFERMEARQTNDTPAPSPWVWERKYEVDSLCFPVMLAKRYYDKTRSTNFLNQEFRNALECIVEVFRMEQNHENYSPYTFQRSQCPPGDTLERNGRGSVTAYTGMTWSGFRPSDDACLFGYHVPSNLFACEILKYIVEFADIMGNHALSAQANELRLQIAKGVDEYAVQSHPAYGEIYAYEVDGLGNRNLMDDANVPSLLSLPYLGVCKNDDPLYRNTRAFALGKGNPYFYTGRYAAGIGSPHTPQGYIWPIALCMQGMTANSADEITRVLKALLATHAGTGFMHESFDPNDPKKFTRPWFAWANSFFGELIYSLFEKGMLNEIIRKSEKMSHK